MTFEQRFRKMEGAEICRKSVLSIKGNWHEGPGTDPGLVYSK